MRVPQILKYYSVTLADERFLGLNPLQLQEDGLHIPMEDFQAGFFSEKITTELFKKYEQTTKARRNYSPSIAEREPFKITLMLSPFHLVQHTTHGQMNCRHPPYLYPLLMEAVLDRKGALYPGKRLPWIERRLLAPLEGDFVLGKMEDYDKFISTKAIRAGEFKKWGDFWAYSVELMEKVSSLHVSKVLNGHDSAFIVQNTKFLLQKTGVAMPFMEIWATENLRKLLDALHTQNKTPPLLNRFLTGRNEPCRNLDTRGIVEASRKHLGQMQGEYGLGESQRIALSHILSPKFNDPDGTVVHAVNGPPGTGKTELLKSVVASLFVEACTTGADHPPVIAAFSSNNQAVTNIIKDFGKIFQRDEKDAPPLEKRWLPKPLHSFGMYAVSENMARTGEVQGFHCTTPDSRFHAQLEDPEYVAKGKEYFLSNAWSYLGWKMSVPEVADQLHKRALELNELLVSRIERFQVAREWSEALPEVKAERKLTEEHLVKILPVHKELCASYEEKKCELTRLKSLRSAVTEYISSESLIYTCLKFLKPIRIKRLAKLQSYLEKRGFEAEPSGSPEDFLSQIEEWLPPMRQRLASILTDIREVEAQMAETEKIIKKLDQKIEHGLSYLLDMCKDFGLPDLSDESLTIFQETQDKTLRHKLFLLAVHYFEAKWLDTVEWSQPYPKGLWSMSPKDRMALWHRDAMLTPCVVSTVFMAPRFFKQSDTFFYNFIDLLVVDEAGQTPPEKISPLMALAKKALIVGDRFQIEPVWGIPQSVDVGNIRRYLDLECKDGTVPEEWRHLSASSGSSMLMAQTACPVHANGFEDPGLHLLEHRRCQEEIIAYCKELIYPQLRVYTKKTESPLGLPHMGYLHIPGESEQVNGSKRNLYEAENIAKWISDNSAALQTHYEGKRLRDVIAVLTPFKLQSMAIRHFLKQNGLGREGIVIGTVHSLQGADKPVCLFSSVYGAEDSTAFIDSAPNLLNVAVSRAKDSFLIFGNMSAFSQMGNTPSSLLMRHVVSGKITMPLVPRRELMNQEGNGVQHLSTLNEHRAALCSALDSARSCVFIVSPLLASAALKNDHVCERIQETKGRGIDVVVYTDPLQNQSRGEDFALCVDDLKKSGADVRLVPKIHNKTLIVDFRKMYEGSFNWLSAQRKGSYVRLEHSILYDSPQVKDFALKALRNLDSREA